MSKSKFNKQEVLDKLQTSVVDILGHSLSKRNTRNLFNTVLNTIVDHVVELNDKESFVLPGFGSFTMKIRTFTIRPGLVGAKGIDKPIKIKRNVITFRPSKMLKDKIKS